MIRKLKVAQAQLTQNNTSTAMLYYLYYTLSYVYIYCKYPSVDDAT